MIKVIGVRFRENGKTYYFDPKDIEIEKDQHVVVETAKGVEYGLVVAGIHEVDDRRVVQPLRPVLRVATERDEQQVARNHEREKEAFQICQDKILEHGLDMKLTEAEYAFDNSKILFYFTADGRIDFRELVKDLASAFHTRIELRQIGVRDEARTLGGYGVCGRPLCCATYLADFVPVSIKMAKEQNLSLNPTKISGVCGRLMCCLKNEEETYEELNRAMPSVGDIVAGNDGVQGEVFSVNILRQTAKVLVQVNDEKELRDYRADQLSMVRRKKGKKGNSTMKDYDSAELEQLEKEELQEKGLNHENSSKHEENKANNNGANNNHTVANEESGEKRQNRGEGREHRQNRDRRDHHSKNHFGQNGHHQNRNEENGENHNGSGQNKDYRKEAGKDSNRDNRDSNRENNKDNKDHNREHNKGGHGGHHYHKNHYNRNRNGKGNGEHHQGDQGSNGNS